MAFCSSWTNNTTIMKRTRPLYPSSQNQIHIGDSTLRDVDVQWLLCVQLCVVTALSTELSEQHCNHGVCRFKYELSDPDEASMLQTSLTGGCILTGDGRWHVLIRLIGWIFFSLILYRLSQSHWQHWHWQAHTKRMHDSSLFDSTLLVLRHHCPFSGPLL